jgi:hypothetical protein
MGNLGVFPICHLLYQLTVAIANNPTPQTYTKMSNNELGLDDIDKLLINSFLNPYVGSLLATIKLITF